MEISEPRRLFLLYLGAANAHDREAMAELLPPSVFINGVPRSRPEVLDDVERIWTAFPDGAWQVQETIANRRRIAVRTRFTGTHRGAFHGAPPTGRTVAIDDLAFYRWQQGRLAEFWGLGDEAQRRATR